MNPIAIVKAKKLKRPPTSICSAFGRVYVATKGRRVFYFSDDGKTSKSIKFACQVNSVCSNNDTLFCAQADGKIFGLNEASKSIFKVSSGDSSIICSAFCEDLFVADGNGKITVFGTNSLVKNSYFIESLSVTDFDISKSKILAVSFQNSQKICIFETSSKKESTSVKLSEDYPEICKILAEDQLVIGTTKGLVSIFSMITKKRISFCKLGSKIASVHIINRNLLLVGTVNSKISLISISDFNKMDIVEKIDVDGIPVDFCSHNGVVVCALSRESRLGRWDLNRKAHNQIIHLKIDSL